MPPRAPIEIGDLRCGGVFTFELQQRLAAAGAQAIAVAGHPGAARTEFTHNVGPLVRTVATSLLTTHPAPAAPTGRARRGIFEAGRRRLPAGWHGFTAAEAMFAGTEYMPVDLECRSEGLALVAAELDRYTHRLNSQLPTPECRRCSFVNGRSAV